MTQRTYVAVYERDPEADAWNVRIDGLPGCQTYGRSVRQAQSRIREALALWLEVEPDQLLVQDEFPQALAEVADRVVRARQEADVAGARARSQTQAAVLELTGLGLSRRDAAELLGLSHQRVQQLLDAG